MKRTKKKINKKQLIEGFELEDDYVRKKMKNKKKEKENDGI